MRMWLPNLLLAACSAIGALLAVEGACRICGCEFDSWAWRQTPPYYRQPITPQGEVYFRRSGPETWTGRVIASHLRSIRIWPHPYSDENPVTVRYDANGFRNPPGLKDWTVVVAGDSFTELGYLPQEDLFTSRLAEFIGSPVLNLGVSYTGPLSQLSYIASYGLAPTARHAIIVFFEGNDLDDLAQEAADLAAWERTGIRPERVLPSQPSVIRFIVRQLRHARAPYQNVINAHYKSVDGPVAVSVNYIPPNWAELEPPVVRALDYFLSRFSMLARANNLTPWLAYMPCKHRVLHDRLVYAANASPELSSWRPSDLAEGLRQRAESAGIRFIDLTPPLLEETRRHGRLLYNPIYDTHLNAVGSHIVARALAAALQSDAGTSQHGETPPAR